MADYQLLGYHPGYSANPSQQNPPLTSSQTGSSQPPGIGMPNMPGQQPYHSLPATAPRPGYPQITDPLMTHKMHQPYSGYGPPSATSPSLRSQYSQNYLPSHGSLDSYGSLSMSQSHMAPVGHSLSGSYGQHQAMIGQYPGQRLHSPSSLHAASAPRHPSMPSHYVPPYGSSSQSGPSSYHSGSSADLWSSGQAMSHLQQAPPPSPFSSFQSSSTVSSNSQTSTLNTLHSSRSSQFSSVNDYASSASNPYFSNHMPGSDSSTSYSNTSYPSVSTQPPTTSSRSSSSSRTQQQQPQYGSQIAYNSNSTSTPMPAQQTNQSPSVTGANSTLTNSVPRFSHYPSYSQNMSYDPGSQTRLSPYPPSSNNSSSTLQTPNSPQYRSSGSNQTPQLPVNSPRRPTATSPAGSPMPPTSHTPGPSSVGSNSTQNSNPGSAFSMTAASSSHHLPNSVPAVPSSLQQLEQMVMPHLGGGTNSSNISSVSTSKTTNSASSSTTSFYSSNTSNPSSVSPPSQSQSKIFSHYGSSASNSQFPYHHYPPSQSGNSVNWSLPSSNTHSLKSGSIMPLTHSSSHLSTTSSSTNNSKKSHSNESLSIMSQPYTLSQNSNKNSGDSENNNDYSQSAYNSTAASSYSSSSTPTVSHSVVPSGGYMSNSTYDSMSNQKQQSSKNNTQSSVYDPSKSSRSLMDPLSGESNQLSTLNSNHSYHSMMQPYGGYSNQPRFDQTHSMSSQYGMPPELSNSSYNTEHDSSMIYDPYNIDNALNIAPPHQTMAEYRESQANLQQSGSTTDYSQNDPYAANFDDFETISKRKGKGRPKKDTTTATVKKERKPRQPRASTGRGTRGRGRGSKAMLDRVPLPGLMPDYGDPSSLSYDAAPSIPLGANNDSIDMYGSNLDMYNEEATPMGSLTKLGSPVDQLSMSTSFSTLSQPSSTVLPQTPPSTTRELISPYDPRSATPSSQLSQSKTIDPNIGHLSHQTSCVVSPTPSVPPPPTILPPSKYDSVENDSNYVHYVNESTIPTNDQMSNVSIIPNSLICDKDSVSSDSTKVIPPSYVDSSPHFMPDSSLNKDSNNSLKSGSNQFVPHSPLSSQPVSHLMMETNDVDKSLQISSTPIGFKKHSILPTELKPINSVSSILPPIPQVYSTEKLSQDRLIDSSESGDNFDTLNNLTSIQLKSQQPALSSLPNQVDLTNTSYDYSESDINLQNLNNMTSTPKDKPKKKRKAKKVESLDLENDESIETSKPKSKKKKSNKKRKSEETIDISLENSVDFDEKTQLSMNFDSSIPENEPKPTKFKSKPKKRKSAKTPKLDPIIDGQSVIENEVDTEPIAIEPIASVSETEPILEDKKPKLKNKSVKKKMPRLALKLKQNKKRRRGFESPENSDLDKTPPPSPEENDESATHKRRSARNTKRQRYNVDIEIDLSDDEFVQKSKDDDSQVVNVQLTEDTMVVEKILSSRMAKREVEVDSKENDKEEPTFVEVEEYYVKYKNLSYLHCDWKVEEELEKGDKRINQKIRRYKQKKDVSVFDFDDEPFNPDYVEVDRVLDVNEIEEIITDEPINENKNTEILEQQELIEEKNSIEDIIVKIEESLSSEVSEEKKNSEDMPKDQNSIKIEENTIEKDESVLEKLKNDSEKSENSQEKVEINFEKVENNVEAKVENKEILDKIISDVSDEKLISQSVKIETPKEKTRIVRHFLVKWRGLAYEESTWELEDDIDPVKIQQFYKFKDPPPRSEWKQKKRPKASDWKKLEQSPVYKSGNTLREYQLEGVNWLSFCWHNDQNCILADEMGLGKTIQSITFIQEAVNYGIPFPYLVIAPLSTIGNWQREFETWTDLNVITYHGSTPSRNMLQEYEMYYKNDKNERIPNIYKFQVMITTFEVILSDCIELSKIKWVACIIDEAHRLKNRNCKLLEGLRMLSIDHRVLLTGTPLQNNVEELFSLLHFLEPAQFTSNENFMAEFGDLKTEAQVDKLKAILKPMMLRRLKEDVEKSLAPKEETIIEVELTNVQKKYYRAILERNFQFLSKGGTYTNIPNLMNTVMELRKCCIHPYLINGAEEQILLEFRQQHCEESPLNAIVQSSGKLVLIDKLLPRLKENGHRVLIFSQMVRCLDILEDYLCQKRYPYERIDGRVRGNLRQAAIDRFSKPDSDRFVFLLCTRAGGLGINLTAADTVIIFDSDWNPQNDLQAQARCHRIGQKKSVKVYRLICRNTYEREMFDRASLKLGLDKAVLQSINSPKNLNDNQLSKKEIEDLLRKGAYGALMDDDSAGDKFCEEDIDMILQRRTTKIVIESEGKGSTFSKASFATSDNRTDIEIDDPNFWEKWAKKANFDVDELKGRNELIVQEPRRRTQTKRFGADETVLDISELSTSTDDEEAISMRTRGSRNRVPTKKRKKGRFYDPEHDEDYAQEIGFGWTRSEFFKVEKGLLTFGWARWDECLILANFKRNLSKQDVEDISRVILLFALQNYKGDEKVKAFILDLIVPQTEKLNDFDDVTDKSELENELKNRRSKKVKGLVKSVSEELENCDWAKSEKYNPDLLLVDETYRKHLLRHANKILLRVRLLAYIKNEIIGDLHEKVFDCLHVRDIPIPYCQPDGEPPAPWWNEEADRSLIIGVYKHGYDRFNLMRQDPALCFLACCGPPDGAALLAEMTSEDDIGKTLDYDEEPETPATPSTPQLEAIKEEKDIPNSSKQEPIEVPKDIGTKESEQNYLVFPTTSEINNRLRRLVTCYQRNFKKEEAKIAQKARHLQRLERLEKFEAAIRERENKKREQAQKKWSRREESDFYRVVSSFGIEYKKQTDTYDWTKFRQYAKLERKLDETLTEYFRAFFAMCKKVAGRRLTEDEENLPISVDVITEERANRCLVRIELLTKVREEILTNPELDERLKLCQPQLDLPDWWICGKHDKDLLIGAAKYGLSRLDYGLMSDPDLSFIEIVKNFDAQTELNEKFEMEVETDIKSIMKFLMKSLEDKNETHNKEASNEIENEIELNNKKLDEVDNSKLENENFIEKIDVDNNSTTKISNIESSVELKNRIETPDIIDSFVLFSHNKPQLKWPRDRVLQIRLENVCLCVEKNEWPTFRSMTSILPQSTTPSIATADSSPRPSTPCSMSSQEATPHPTPDHTPRRDAQSPFTGEYFYPVAQNTAPNAISSNNFDESNRKRRRRRTKKIDLETDRNKLQSLLNVPFDQPTPPTIPPSSKINSNLNNTLNNSNSTTFSPSIFKNVAKNNSLLNNFPTHLLTPLLNNLPFNIRNSLSREDFLNDEKAAALLFGSSFSSNLAMASSSTIPSKSSTRSTSNVDNKKNTQSGPPPAHQSSSRNSLTLGSLDLTSKFKSATSSVLEKSTPPAPNLSNLYPAHKQSPKNLEKADVLDLSSVPSKNDSKSISSMANLLVKNTSSNDNPPISHKRKGRFGSRIDDLALKLQGKKMAQEEKTSEFTITSLPNQFTPPSLPSTSSTASSGGLPKTLFNDKDLLAAFTNLASQQHNDKRQSNLFFDELSKSALFSTVKNKSPFNTPSSLQTALSSKKPSVITSSASSVSTNDATKAYLNMLNDSLKLLSKAPSTSEKNTINTPPSKSDLAKQKIKTLFEQNPEFLSQSSTLMSLMNNPLFSQSMTNSASSSNLNFEDKSKNTRGSKRSRSHFENPASDELLTKKANILNMASMSSLIDPKKYLSTLLDKNNVDVDAKIKNMIKEKSSSLYKTHTQVSSIAPITTTTTSSMRTRTSDKRSSASSSNVSNNQNSANPNNASNLSNMNASNLLNNLSLAAAASNSNKQQAASSLLANTYANAYNLANAGKSNSNFTNQNQNPSFSNFGFNQNMLSGIPSMKLFLDAAAAAVSKGMTSSMLSPSVSTVSSTATSSTTTSATPSLSSFANLFGLNNPLFNLSNFANLANLNQPSTNKKDSTSNIDIATLANSLANVQSSASGLNTNDDKSKSKGSLSAQMNSKMKNSLAATSSASNLLGSSNLSSAALPFLYSNPNFAMSSLYNPLNFGLASPFLNNPNLMNGLANFSNVFTTSTNTTTTTVNHSSKPKSSTSSSKSKGLSSSTKAPSTVLPPTLSISSINLPNSRAHSKRSSAPIDSNDKSLVDNEDEDDINGTYENIGKTMRSSDKKSKSTKQTMSKDAPKSKKMAATSK